MDKEEGGNGKGTMGCSLSLPIPTIPFSVSDQLIREVRVRKDMIGLLDPLCFLGCYCLLSALEDGLWGLSAPSSYPYIYTAHLPCSCFDILVNPVEFGADRA